MSMLRNARWGAVAALLVGSLAACDPVPPPTHITVTRVADGVDASPGDGVCEVTPGVGDCSIRAAVTEANAAGSGIISVRSGSYSLTVPDVGDGDPDLDVTGNVQIPIDPSHAVSLSSESSGVFEVQTGGHLTANGIGVGTYSGDPAIVVAGHLVLGESRVTAGHESGGPAALEVEAGGNALVSNTFLTNTILAANPGAATVVNRGSFKAYYSSLSGYLVPVLHTDPGAHTELGATRLTRYGYFIRTFVESTETACTGVMPASLGYNWVTSSTCNLTEPTDRQSLSESWVDMIPPGALGCGDAYTIDIGGSVRPGDGDYDGVAACDIGAGEGGVRVTLTSALRAGTVGECYLDYIRSTPSSSETWSVEGLPPGLTVDGTRVKGIPTQAGTFEVTMRVKTRDGGGIGTNTLVIAPSSEPPMVAC